MNKLEANISLLAITFFAAIQYVFLAAVPADISSFSFMFITNLIGFVFALLIFFGELFRLNRKQLLQSLVLAAELFGFNIFLLLGSQGLDASFVSCIVALYFVFLPLILLLMHRKVKWNSYLGVLFVVIGVFMVMGTGLDGFKDIHVLFLILSDLCFAFYIITVENFCAGSNPAILAMGQMFFGSLFALAAWILETVITGKSFALPTDISFWGSVIFISFFIRSLYGVVQIYAQRYVSALNTSLIFSTEIIITLLISPLISVWMGFTPSVITPLKLFGCLFIVAGVLAADGEVMGMLKRRKKNAA